MLDLMRVFAASLAIVLLLLLPEIAEVKDWTLPDMLRSLVFVPATGFGYMTVFFHELGHTVVSWSYGRPAVPAFDFANGGGVSMPIAGRSLILQGLVYVSGLGFAVFLFQAGAYALMAALLALMGVHALFVTGEHYEIPVNYMGNGGAVVTGCFFIYRAALNKTLTESGQLMERCVNMIFGLFAVGNGGLVLAWKLMTSDIARDVYDAGKGESHMANDFTVIADRLDTTLQRVAEFHLFFTLLCLCVTATLILAGLRAQGGEDETDVPTLHRLPRSK